MMAVEGSIVSIGLIVVEGRLEAGGSVAHSLVWGQERPVGDGCKGGIMPIASGLKSGVGPRPVSVLPPTALCGAWRDWKMTSHEGDIVSIGSLSSLSQVGLRLVLCPLHQGQSRG